MILNFGRYRLEQRGDEWWLICNATDEGMTVTLLDLDLLLHRHFGEQF